MPVKLFDTDPVVGYVTMVFVVPDENGTDAVLFSGMLTWVSVNQTVPLLLYGCVVTNDVRTQSRLDAPSVQFSTVSLSVFFSARVPPTPLSWATGQPSENVVPATVRSGTFQSAVTLICCHG